MLQSTGARGTFGLALDATSVIGGAGALGCRRRTTTRRYAGDAASVSSVASCWKK
jgi:hypothetical protein